MLSFDEWEKIEEFVRVLKWPNTLTEQLQAEQLTLSDVYGYWITMEIKLRKENHILADLLLAHLASRRQTILEHPAMNAAVYLDPRFNGLLNIQHRNEAVEFLKTLWKRMKNSSNRSGTDVVGSSRGPISEPIEGDMDADLLAFVQATDERFHQGDSVLVDENIVLSQSIVFFQQETISKVQQSGGILKFWSTAIRFEYFALYKLSRVLLAVPATQASVERAFSGLHFILNDYRTRLGDESLENILLIRLNW